MRLLHERFMLIVSIILNAIYVSCGPGPGTIFYRKPTKLVFYKRFPPVLIYPKASDSDYTPPINSDGENLYAHGLPDNRHAKSGKYFLLNQNFFDHLMQSDEKYYLRRVEKEPVYDNWLSWLFDVRDKSKEQLTISDLNFGLQPSTSYAHFEDSKYSNEPTYTYQTRKPQNTVPLEYQQIPPIKHISYFQPVQHEDVKPVVEHIEGDIKYDFRTKTHSYDK